MKTKVKRKHGRSMSQRAANRARQRATLLIRRDRAGLLPLLVPPIVIATRSIKICVDGPLASKSTPVAHSTPSDGCTKLSRLELDFSAKNKARPSLQHELELLNEENQTNIQKYEKSKEKERQLELDKESLEKQLELQKEKNLHQREEIKNRNIIDKAAVVTDTIAMLTKEKMNY